MQVGFDRAEVFADVRSKSGETWFDVDEGVGHQRFLCILANFVTAMIMSRSFSGRAPQ